MVKKITKKKFLDEIKKILTDKKSDIINKLAYSDTSIDIGSDEVDVIQAKIIAHANAQLAARDKDKLSKIDTALKKIADGTFGYCEECTEAIPEKRLLFNPIFKTCVDCAEHLEKISKRAVR